MPPSSCELPPTKPGARAGGELGAREGDGSHPGRYNPCVGAAARSSPLRSFALAALAAALVLASCREREEPADGSLRSASRTVEVSQASTPPLAPAPPTGGSAPAIRPDAGATSPAPTPAASTVRDAAAPRVVVLGDSLTAGLGLDGDEAWPSLLATRLAAEGRPIRLVNAGVSGDTSAGGLRRVDWVLRQHPDVLVVELGANDALRGQPLDGIEANLREIVRRGRDAGARVLVLGMRVPPSLGGDYAGGFAALYPRLARELDVPLVPFMLAGVAGRPELNLPDGIHPNAEGQRLVAEVVRPYLERLLATGAPATAR